jgi:hypothetical protein
VAAGHPVAAHLPADALRVLRAGSGEEPGR